MQFKYLKYDLYRYFYPDNQVSKIGFKKKVVLVIFTLEIWAIIIYRFRKWALEECHIPLLKGVVKLIGILLQLWIDMSTGICILPYADIGPGLYIGHFGNVIIGYCKLGKLCNISNGISIGVAGRGEARGNPEIGDYVYIAPGAKIIGKIKIGNNVAIGANAVVTSDLPENAVAVGIPAKIISYHSSKDFVEFNKEKCMGIL
jgi:serine O-acetyltransferase